MVNWAIDHLGAQMDAKQCNYQYAKAIAYDPQRNHESDEQCPPPSRPQKKVRHEQAGDEKDQAGVNPAALLGYLNGYPRKLEDDPIT